MERDTDTQGRRQFNSEGEDWSCEARSRGTSEVTRNLEQSRKDFSLEPTEGVQPCLSLDFQPPEPQSNIYLLFETTPVCHILLWWPQKNNVGGYFQLCCLCKSVDNSVFFFLIIYLVMYLLSSNDGQVCVQISVTNGLLL